MVKPLKKVLGANPHQGAFASERKANRMAIKLQKWQGQVVEAKAAGKAAPFRIIEKTKLMPGQGNLSKIEKQIKQAKKAEREKKWNELSPAGQQTIKDRQTAKAAADKANNVKEINRSKRVDLKKVLRESHRADAKQKMKVVADAYKASLKTGTVPKRDAKYNTPQGGE